MRAVWAMVGFLVAFCAFFASSSFATSPPWYDTELGAANACEAALASYKAAGGSSSVYCKLAGTPGSTGQASCTVSNVASLQFYTMWSDAAGGIGSTFDFCFPASCTGTWGSPSNTITVSPATATAENGDFGGCCVSWVGTGVWSFDGVSGASGYYQRTGAYCAQNYSNEPAPPSPPVPGQDKKYCDSGSVSCYSPQTNTACYATESGEQICKQLNAPADNCAVGATGASCYSAPGGQPPSPPDPPISTGQPPNQSGTASTTSGGVTNNYTFNNYSGTSPGPGGQSPASGSTSGSGGGSGSNANGNGNSGQNGTNANGNCPNGSKPTASGCSGTYTDNGCNTPPQCFGDAVLCGIAASDHKTACGVSKLAAASGSSSPDPYAGAPSSGSLTLPSSGDPTDASGDPTASSVSNDVDLGDTSSLDSTGFGFGATCPLTDGIHFGFLGKPVDVDTSALCTPLSFIKYIVLAFAYFSAAKIMAGVK